MNRTDGNHIYKILQNPFESPKVAVKTDPWVMNHRKSSPVAARMNSLAVERRLLAPSTSWRATGGLNWWSEPVNFVNFWRLTGTVRSPSRFRPSSPLGSIMHRQDMVANLSLFVAWNFETLRPVGLKFSEFLRCRLHQQAVVKLVANGVTLSECARRGLEKLYLCHFGWGGFSFLPF